MIPDGQRDEYLEIYKLSVEGADRISARRGTANTFFLAVNGALATTAAILQPVAHASSTAPGPKIDRISAVLIATVGLVLAVAWWALLRSYRDLNTAKYKVIQRMEAELPAAPFTDEWNDLKQSTERIKGWRKRYAELGWVEQVVPAVFAIVYVVALVRAFLA